VSEKNETLAYVIGVALGDGNLSCPNGRATRLRVTCDNKYPNIIIEIVTALTIIFPRNKVSLVTSRKGNCTDVSVYSNILNDIIPWKVGEGSKIKQQARVPDWIMCDTILIKACLRGLLQTDGSIYNDRGYTMVNFTNLIKPLIDDVYKMITTLTYEPHLYSSIQPNGNIKYVVRVSKNVSHFIAEIKLQKS
jgi:LAGLIDADG-like domain